MLYTENVALRDCSKFLQIGSHFMKLPYHNHITQVHPDAMLTVKDCIERVFFLYIGKINLDNIKSCETSIGMFFYTSSNCTGCKCRKGKAVAETMKAHGHPIVLSSDELKLADTRSKSIVVPNNDFVPGSRFHRTTAYSLFVILYFYICM